jgi:hypothetical protein
VNLDPLLWNVCLLSLGILSLILGVRGSIRRVKHPDFMAEHLWKEANVVQIIAGISLIVAALLRLANR